MIVPVILAGGSGTRLWPLSRELYPKQMIRLVNDNTMLQNTLVRLAGLERCGAPLVICNQEHRFMAAEQLRAINIAPHAIILEPVGRNTAPAVAVAALKLMENDQDPLMLVLPADHDIKNIPNFTAALEQGRSLAETDVLVTFGIVPQGPETGYGYIRKGELLDPASGASRLSRFVEKPDRKTAETYVASGDYCWNSGMFMFRASTILRELTLHAPDIVSACRAALTKGVSDLDFFRLEPDAFFLSPSDSLDYSVMEKTDQGVVVPIDAGWNDLGSWDALWSTGEKDKNNNVVLGDVITRNAVNSYFNAQSRLIAAVGVSDLVVVETKDAVLVASREQVQDVKSVVESLRTTSREEAVSHTEVFRPWGSYEGIDSGNRFQVKRICVKPGAKLSLQKHFHRAEHWTVVSGTAIVTKGDKEILLRENESTYIPLGVMHRLENPGRIPLELIEVQSGPYLGEDDIVRFDDIYGRSKD